MTTQTLDRQNRSAKIIPLAAIAAGAALVAVVAFAAVGGGRGDGNGQGGIAAPPATAAPPAPSKAPTPKPTAEPTDDGSDAMPIRVDIETVAGGDVYVDIVDSTGYLVDAKSGTPAEGQSVGQYTLEVENLDATTLKLSWVDYPIENALTLYVDKHDDAIRLLLIQPAPNGPTDAIALDRELILSFSRPIAADQVESFLQEGLDTPG